MSDSTLKDKKALVTGGASGIGAAAVRALAQRGAHVIVADIDPQAAETMAQEVDGEAWAVDLTDTAALADLSLVWTCWSITPGFRRLRPFRTSIPLTSIGSSPSCSSPRSC